jgi:hypothetical protein
MSYLTYILFQFFERQPMDPSALPAGSSQVRLAQRRFNTEDDDEAGTPKEEPARHPTDSASEAASSAPASESAATPTTGTKNA